MDKMQSNTKVAGVDVGKHRLDVAVHGLEELGEFDNSPSGLSALVAWLKAREVGRVGMEASGGYERSLRLALEVAGLEVVVHQPLEVRLFARLKRKRAKNDRLDARLIAAATAQIDALRAAQDPRLVALAEWMTTYEQITDQLAELRVFMEHVTIKAVASLLKAQITRLVQLKARLAATVVAGLKAHPDLAARFRLVMSLPGVGPIVAASLVIRMPELGSLNRGQAASLLGVAPFDRDSGQFHGRRTIAGGRQRPRRMMYLAALAAKRCDVSLRTFAERLLVQGKPPKVIVVAVMRKLIEAANLVLLRGQPWVRHQSA